MRRQHYIHPDPCAKSQKLGTVMASLLCFSPAYPPLWIGRKMFPDGLSKDILHQPILHIMRKSQFWAEPSCVLLFSSIFEYWWNLHVNRLFASYGPICSSCSFFTWSLNYNWHQTEMSMTSPSGDQGFRWEIRCWSRWTSSSEQRSCYFVNIHCIRMRVRRNTETGGKKNSS